MTQMPNRVPPVAIRSRMVLELASDLIEQADWPHRRVHISLRDRDFETAGFTLYGSGSPDGIDLVARGEAHLAMINPSAVLTMAYRGTGPYPEPIPVRIVTVIGSYDQIALAVAESTGLRTLAEIRERQYPLRVSIRGPRGNSVALFVNEVCKAAGFALDDIERWGGKVDYDYRLPALRIADVESGAYEALFDEAVMVWANRAARSGMTFLPIDGSLREAVAPMGMRPGVLSKATYPNLPADVQTLDFSGFPLYTRADVPDAEVRAICAALEARRSSLPWEGDGPMPLERMCKESSEGPFDVPLHPAAEAFWHEQGYL